MLEELLALGVSGAEYDAADTHWRDQFSSGFVEINPNSKIPALSDHSTTPPTRVFESGNILLYLAENLVSSCRKILPVAPKPSTGCSGCRARRRSSAAASATSITMRRESSTRSTALMEAKRQLDVLDKQLARGRYVAGRSTPSPIWLSGRGMAT